MVYQEAKQGTKVLPKIRMWWNWMILICDDEAEMLTLCSLVSDQFDEDLENNLISYFRPPIGQLELLITKVCHNLTKYCEGHDKEAERNKKDQVSNLIFV